MKFEDSERGEKLRGRRSCKRMIHGFSQKFHGWAVEDDMKAYTGSVCMSSYGIWIRWGSCFTVAYRPLTGLPSSSFLKRLHRTDFGKEVYGAFLKDLKATFRKAGTTAPT